MIFRDHYTGRGHQVPERDIVAKHGRKPNSPPPPPSSPSLFVSKIFRPVILSVSPLSLSSSPSARSIPLAPFPSSLLSRGSRLDNFLVIRWALVKTEESSLHVVSSVASFVSPRKIRSPKSRRERDRHRVEAWRFGRIRTGEILDLDKSNGRLAFRKLIAPCGSLPSFSLSRHSFSSSSRTSSPSRLISAPPWQKSLSLSVRWRVKRVKRGFLMIDELLWGERKRNCGNFHSGSRFSLAVLELESWSDDNQESGRKWKRYVCSYIYMCVYTRCITIPFTIISRIAFSTKRVLHLNFSPCFFLFHSSSWKDTCRKISSGIWNASMDVACPTSSARPETLSTTIMLVEHRGKMWTLFFRRIVYIRIGKICNDSIYHWKTS